MDIRQKLFFIAGADFFQRQRAIESLKKRVLKSNSSSLNTSIIYCKDIDSKDLQEKVLTKSFDSRQIFIFKDCLKLSTVDREFILANLKKILSGAYIVLETEKNHYSIQKEKKISTDKFFSFVLKHAAIIRVSSYKKYITIVDLIYSLKRQDLSSSLYILESLFKEGVNQRLIGPQVIGILTNSFSRTQDINRRKRCLDYIWQADRLIKEKGENPRLVIESLLVKLSQFS